MSGTEPKPPGTELTPHPAPGSPAGLPDPGRDATQHRARWRGGLRAAWS